MRRGCTGKRYNTDILMKNLFGYLVRDFASITYDDFAGDQLRALDFGMREFRLCNWPTLMAAPPYVFKRVYQLQNLFKRYTFTPDVYTPVQLEELTNSKFLATQARIAGTPYNRSELFHRVVQTARKIIKSILKEYDLQEHMSLCKFGKKATVGNPLSQSYLDVKLEEGCSGSSEHIEWMKNVYLPTDPILSEILLPDREDWRCIQCESLTLTNVPKSWKSLRSIMPNTLFGTFYTYGLGRMIQARLKEAGLDIRRLQERHKVLARKSSLTRENTTADLSAASDSFTSALINMLLPRKWFRAFSLGRLTQVQIDEKQYYMHSFMGMGVGFTFPLQTLCFYGLIKAIGELAQIEGTYSVYGDDLIYPRRLHRYVRQIFPMFGLLLNEDKTFSEDFFRESCGGDYYRGIDVRPFSPEGHTQQLSRIAYLSLLYKTINGLTRRWDRSEISQTLHFLLTEVTRVSSVIHQVPMTFPDDAGVKVDKIQTEWHIPWSKVKYSKTGCCLKFGMLTRESDKRIVNSQLAYYWFSLRAASQKDVVIKPLCQFGSIKTYISRHKWISYAAESLLEWACLKERDRKKGGKIKRIWRSVVPLKQSEIPRLGEGSISNWTLGA